MMITHAMNKSAATGGWALSTAVRALAKAVRSLSTEGGGSLYRNEDSLHVRESILDGIEGISHGSK